MIFSKSDYNPFPSIKEMIVKKGDRLYTQGDLDTIRKELFKGGLVPEDTEEFNKVLDTLAEMDII